MATCVFPSADRRTVEIAIRPENNSGLRECPVRTSTEGIEGCQYPVRPGMLQLKDIAVAANTRLISRAIEISKTVHGQTGVRIRPILSICKSVNDAERLRLRRLRCEACQYQDKWRC